MGLAVLLAGGLPWGAVLAPLNLRFFPAVPWAVVPMAAYLWFYWRFIGGRLGSPVDAERRRTLLRANPVSPDVWPIAIGTGLLGFGALLTGVSVMARVVTMPESAMIERPEEMPFITLFVLLVMASLVAGVTEEAGFRGYMQGPIERRYGLAAAILVNGVMFGVMHFPNHPDAVLTMLPYYVAVSALYGGITWATNSILPSLVLHAGGDVWSLTRLWITGRPEWQIATTSAPTQVWDTGVDAPFILSALACLVLTAATVAGCRAIRRATGDVTDRH
jgi:membrane protease YdiL (CAAX protease family)